MGKVDFDKFICDFAKRTQYRHLVTEMQDVLKKQGLECKDGKIAEIEYHCTGVGNPKEAEGVLKEMIDKPFELKAGQMYVCIRNFDDAFGTRAFTKWSMYKSTEDGTLIPDNSNIPYRICEPYHYFRLAKKREPMFNIGDWIVDKETGDKLKVIKVLDHTYKLTDQDGEVYYIPHYNVEELFGLLQEDKKEESTTAKFNIGDLVVDNTNCVWRIISIASSMHTHRYYLQNLDSPELFLKDDIELVDKTYHLWTIQDAKEGDVLTDRCIQFSNPLIFILKKFEHVNFGLVTPSDYSSHCFLMAGEEQAFKVGSYHHMHNIQPATKEQCELLFDKMHNAGYVWDAENKVLKKTQKPEEKMGEFENALCLFMQKFRLEHPGFQFNGEIAEYVEKHSEELLNAARKQIVGDTDANNMVN